MNETKLQELFPVKNENVEELMWLMLDTDWLEDEIWLNEERKLMKNES